MLGCLAGFSDKPGSHRLSKDLDECISVSPCPCVDTSSFTFLLHTRLHTWLPVSTQLSAVLVSVMVFQERMQRSALPPPLASKPRSCGLQAMALTATEQGLTLVQLSAQRERFLWDRGRI